MGNEIHQYLEQHASYILIVIFDFISEGLQAIQLEDGTTAYITHPTTENLFGDAGNCSLESTSLSLEQLTGQVRS